MGRGVRGAQQMEEALRQLEQVIQGSQVWRSRASCGAKEREVRPVWEGTQDTSGSLCRKGCTP